MRRAVLLLATLAPPVAAQTTVRGGTITAPGVRIDEGGIHTPGVTVDGSGVHATSRPGDTVISANGGTRSVDCGGKGLSVQGNGNHLTVANCRRVDVLGNGNTLNARFAAPGSLTVAGNHNTATWSAPRGVAVSATAMGNGDRVTRRD